MRRRENARWRPVAAGPCSPASWCWELGGACAASPGASPWRGEAPVPRRAVLWRCTPRSSFGCGARLLVGVVPDGAAVAPCGCGKRLRRAGCRSARGAALGDCGVGAGPDLASSWRGDGGRGQICWVVLVPCLGGRAAPPGLGVRPLLVVGGVVPWCLGEILAWCWVVPQVLRVLFSLCSGLKCSAGQCGAGRLSGGLMCAGHWWSVVCSLVVARVVHLFISAIIPQRTAAGDGGCRGFAVGDHGGDMLPTWGAIVAGC